MPKIMNEKKSQKNVLGSINGYSEINFVEERFDCWEFEKWMLVVGDEVKIR